MNEQARLDQLASRVEIADLVSKYCLGCDRRDADEFMSIWHEDAVYDLGEVFGGAHKGLEAVEQALNAMWGALAFTRHWTTNLVIDFEGEDRATGRSEVCFDCEDAEGTFFFGGASYEDVFERREGAWKFTRREVIIHYRKVLEAADYGA